jgi:phage terminase large subunit-like protein
LPQAAISKPLSGSPAIAPEKLLKKLELELSKRKNLKKLADYRPYPKQKEFHANGAKYTERLFMAGNQLGKTLSGGFEMAMHLTGRYPDWWEGRRWDRAVNAWAAGITGESTRDTIQRILVGRPGEHGTGAIPKECLVDVVMARGTPNLLDSVKVRHENGELSHLTFKAYEKGVAKFAGETLDIVWLDEECELDVYTECLTRTNATNGIVFMTFTPLLGMSKVVSRFLLETPTSAIVTKMTISDVEHYSKEQIEKIIAQYPAYEREARLNGTPMLGSGRVFPVPASEITVEPFPIPTHWPRLNALDFGWDHPSAGVSVAWDRDTDCIYITHAHRAREQTPLMFAAAVKPWGDWIPWAWPHDGLQHDKGSGDQLAAQYAMAGLKMLPQRATFEDGTNGLEAGVMEMLDRMNTGRLKVFSTLAMWFEEFELYHRKDGLIEKKKDDLLSATRYAVMMRREAKVKQAKRRFVDYKAGSSTSWMS